MSKPDLSKASVEIIKDEADWDLIYKAALFTVGLSPKHKEPTSEWKKKILLSEHSPIYIGRVFFIVKDVPAFVNGHLVRHGIGTLPYIQSQREDLHPVEVTPDRNTLQNGLYVVDFEAIINISRKRLCKKASIETRYVWKLFLDELKKYEPELVELCVPNCVYRNKCPEFKTCGYFDECLRNK